MAACPQAQDLPASCEDGQILVSVAGQWQCGSPPAYVAPLQEYGCVKYPKGAWGSDGKLLSCAVSDLNTGQLLQQAKSSLAQVETRAATLRPQPALSTYRGVTTATSIGVISAPGVENGEAAAAARCSREYAGSHLCSVFELYDSVVRGKLTSDSRVPKSWIYFPTGSAPTGADRPLDGIADSRAGYTYGLDDRGWSGRAAEWTVLSTGFVGFKLHGGTSARCSAPLPLACCGGTQ